MTRTIRYALLLALVVIVVAWVAWFWPRATPAETIDLVERFTEAEKRTTLDSLHTAFAIVEATIDGDTRKAIFAHAFSRIVWTVDMPPEARLETAVAMQPYSWNAEGDGVVFRIGVSDGEQYDELFRQRLAPFEVQADRRWFPVSLDLSPYAGRRVQIIFNTDAGDAGNNANDASIWGSPRIVTGAATTGD